jgi:hypothetical protein
MLLIAGVRRSVVEYRRTGLASPATKALQNSDSGFMA